MGIVSRGMGASRSSESLNRQVVGTFGFGDGGAAFGAFVAGGGAICGGRRRIGGGIG